MRVLISVLALTALSGCSKITALQQSVAEIDNQNDSLRAELARFERQYYQVQLEEMKANKISQELMLLRIEEQLVQLSGNVNESHARLSEINQKTGELTAQLREKAQKDSLKVTLANAERRDMFDLGVKDVQLGNHSQAISTFTAFIEAYPDAAEKGDAIYWIAESQLALKKYDDAEKQLKMYIKEYKEGSFFCTAIYKLGVVYDKKEDTVRRDALWDELKSRCPNSKETKLVKGKK